MLIIFTPQRSQVNTASLCVCVVCVWKIEMEREREKIEKRHLRYSVRAVDVITEFLKN